MDKRQQTVHEIYYGSDGGATRRLMTQLEKTGQLGRIAAQLFRAQKASSRAKVYRGGLRHKSGDFSSYRGLAYDNKEKALLGLSVVLNEDSQGLRWGWKPDPNQRHAKFLLYVDLPTGQCSFHSPMRHVGPDYGGEWDGEHGSETRIVEFCESVLAEKYLSQRDETCVASRIGTDVAERERNQMDSMIINKTVITWPPITDYKIRRVSKLCGLVATSRKGLWYFADQNNVSESHQDGLTDAEAMEFLSEWAER
jgi:hypothetical protein